MPVHELYGPVIDAASRANSGADHLLASDNIAIVAVTTWALFATVAAAVLLVAYIRLSNRCLNTSIASTQAMTAIDGSIDELKAIFRTVIDLYKSKPTRRRRKRYDPPAH